MANTKSSTTAKTSEKKAAEATDVVSEPQKFVASEVDVHEYIPVRNGFHGVLVYQSKKTGETFIWDEFGDEQEIELQELKSAKSASKKFFQNNYFMFDKDYQWVIDYLGMRQFYKLAIDADNYDDLFKMTPAALEKVIATMSDGQKSSMSYRARQLISQGDIDSNKIIATLEKGLGVELVER